MWHCECLYIHGTQFSILKCLFCFLDRNLKVSFVFFFLCLPSLIFISIDVNGHYPISFTFGLRIFFLSAFSLAPKRLLLCGNDSPLEIYVGAFPCHFLQAGSIAAFMHVRTSKTPETISRFTAHFPLLQKILRPSEPTVWDAFGRWAECTRLSGSSGSSSERSRVNGDGGDFDFFFYFFFYFSVEWFWQDSTWCLKCDCLGLIYVSVSLFFKSNSV